MLVLLLAALSGSPPSAPIPEISDAALSALAAHGYDKSKKAFHTEVLGVNHGQVVVADYPCSDVCPDDTTRIIHYRATPEACAAAGGVVQTLTVPVGIAVMRRPFCVPRVLSRP